MKNTDSRTGFTLVELLVVTGLLASLFGLMTVLGRPNLQSSVRRAAQDFASQLLSTQSRALGKSEGAAVLVAPLAGSPRVGAFTQEATTHPLLVRSVTGMPPSPPPDPRTPTATVTVDADADTLQTVHKIRFQTGSGPTGPTVSPWFEFTAPNTVRFRASSGQTVNNTIWPKASGAVRGVLARYPSPRTSAKPLPKTVAIDLRHSGVGEEPTAPHQHGRFEGKGTIAIAYEQVGRIGDVMQKVLEARTATDPSPIVPSEIVYFLFAPRADIIAGVNTLASQQSVWVAVHPLSGRAAVAANVPQSGDDAAALKAARANAREGVAIK